jgi:hypothetical protein
MILALITLALVMFAIRLRLLHRVWTLPQKHGEGFFIAQPVKAGFYREAGAMLLRRYQISIIVPILLDLPLAIWLAVTWRHMSLVLEQLFVAMLSTVAYNVMVVHFSARAATLSGEQESLPPTAFQLSMAPRRLRDHTNFIVESIIAVATLLSLGLLLYMRTLAVAPGATHAAVHAFHGGLLLTTWVLYWQIGLLLLKGVFVRWRMPLPVSRTEEFRRWRAAWLSHHMKIFDAGRLLLALSLLGGSIKFLWGKAWPRGVQLTALGASMFLILVYFAYIFREGRRIAATARELKPLELVKEFPRTPVAQGRYLAGGLLYFNRDNPRVIVRGVQGIAINLAHRSTYAWAAYFLGLAALMLWIAR